MHLVLVLHVAGQHAVLEERRRVQSRHLRAVHHIDGVQVSVGEANMQHHLTHLALLARVHLTHLALLARIHLDLLELLLRIHLDLLELLVRDQLVIDEPPVLAHRLVLVERHDHRALVVPEEHLAVFQTVLQGHAAHSPTVYVQNVGRAREALVHLHVQARHHFQPLHRLGDQLPQLRAALLQLLRQRLQLLDVLLRRLRPDPVHLLVHLVVLLQQRIPTRVQLRQLRLLLLCQRRAAVLLPLQLAQPRLLRLQRVAPVVVLVVHRVALAVPLVLQSAPQVDRVLHLARVLRHCLPYASPTTHILTGVLRRCLLQLRRAHHLHRRSRVALHRVAVAQHAHLVPHLLAPVVVRERRRGGRHAHALLPVHHLAQQARAAAHALVHVQRGVALLLGVVGEGGARHDLLQPLHAHRRAADLHAVHLLALQLLLRLTRSHQHYAGEEVLHEGGEA